tara:strand:+ start:5322 stop:5684 length:363 start_codon:yes stop_codon:yes gene_type:complete
MINGFEKETEPLSADELKALPILIEGFKKLKGKDLAMTAKRISASMKKHHFMIIDGARIRKLVNYIRTNDKVPFLMATSRGYYVAESQEEVIEYIKSLKDRADSIYHVARCLENQLRNRT